VLVNPYFSLYDENDIIGWMVINPSNVTIDSEEYHQDFLRITCNQSCIAGVKQDIEVNIAAIQSNIIKIQCWAVMFNPPNTTVGVLVDLNYYDLSTTNGWSETHELRYINTKDDWQHGLLSFKTNAYGNSVILKDITLWILLNSVGDIGFDNVDLRMM